MINRKMAAALRFINCESGSAFHKKQIITRGVSDNEEIRGIVFRECIDFVFHKQILSDVRECAAAIGVQIYVYLSTDMGRCGGWDGRSR